MAAPSSRCLFAGYRYESPLAGFDEWSWAPPPASPQMTVTSRQGGNNFAGQYYTLFRHYDPNLMRFTSPDPIASPFFNLFHYAGNNPAGAYDPDGLWPEGRPSNHTNFDMGAPGGGGSGVGGSVGGGGGWHGGIGPGFGGPGIGNATMGFENIGAGYASPLKSAVERATDSFARANERDKVLAHESTYSEPTRVGIFVFFTIADFLPSGPGAEAISGTDSVTFTPLTPEERQAKALQATVETALIAAPALVPRGVRWGWNKAKGWRAPEIVPAPRPLRGKGWSYDQIKALKEMRRANPTGKPIANVGPVHGETFGSTRYGLAMEGKMQTWLKGQYPSVGFTFQRRGVDVIVPPGAKSAPFSYAEFKPRTASGRAKFNTQISKWNLPRNQTRVYTYDAQGNIYVGWD
ncbi:MAG: RHS repeat-associated core domain-containing protein [Planctomycetes bacterium]|nr:RHS repeat-associated core domain-containing protein [Planctomycetota bacterium]